MFRIAPIVLLASLCSITTAQSPKAAPKKSAKPEPVAEGTVINAPANSNVNQSAVAEGTVFDGSSSNEYVDNTQPANGSPSNATPTDADALAAQEPADKPLPIKGAADLQMSVLDFGLQANVHGSTPGFWGVFAVSLTPNVAHFDGLPLLLSDAVVMGFGYTKSQDLQLLVPFSMPAKAISLYNQALIIDAHGYWASGIVELVVGGADAQPAIN
ncbi:MAG TPA: hypothetical protein VF384_00975 [Planctomycetota bacterium]